MGQSRSLWPYEIMDYFLVYVTKWLGGFPGHTPWGSHGCLGGPWARWGDVLQKDSDAAIESFWSCQLVEICYFFGLWGCPGSTMGVPRESSWRPRGGLGVTREPRGVPGIPSFYLTLYFCDKIP